MRRICFIIGRFLAIIFPHRIKVSVNKLFGYIRTGYMLSNIKHVGRHVYLYPGVTVKGEEFISIGDSVSVANNTIIAAWPNLDNVTPCIKIGNNVRIGRECLISAVNRIIIGEGTLFGAKITIVDNSHGAFELAQLDRPPFERPSVSKGPVIIGQRVWIGDKVTILPGVTIGDGSIIGANTVVTHTIPKNCVVAGNPCRIIKKLE